MIFLASAIVALSINMIDITPDFEMVCLSDPEAVEEVIGEPTLTDKPMHIKPDLGPVEYGTYDGIVIDEEQWYYLTHCVTAENGGSCDRCLYLTACTILNRCKEGWWHDKTIKQVISRKNQFSVYGSGSMFRVEPHDRIISACKYALNNNNDNWVLFFCDGDLHSRIADLVWYCEKDDTSWYKRKE